MDVPDLNVAVSKGIVECIDVGFVTFLLSFEVEILKIKHFYYCTLEL